MANTYTQLTIHIVFAVKHRENLIKNEFREELYKYIAGVIGNKKHKLLAINGVSDHIHILVGLDPFIALSDLVRDIKNNSSKFINDKKWIKGKFQWQEGFGAFSYARSQRPDVISFIQNQEEHHRKESFRDEYLKILRKFEVDYDERYVFDFFESGVGV